MVKGDRLKHHTAASLVPRPEGISAIHTGMYRPYDVIERPLVGPGHDVTLRRDDVNVHVIVKSVEGNGTYIGQITDFSPPVEESYKDMSTGDTVEFEERHIVGYIS